MNCSSATFSRPITHEAMIGTVLDYELPWWCWHTNKFLLTIAGFTTECVNHSKLFIRGQLRTNPARISSVERTGHSFTPLSSSWRDGATENAWVEMNDIAHIRNGQNIRHRKKKSNMLHHKHIKSCLSRFDSAATAVHRPTIGLTVTEPLHGRARGNIDSSSTKAILDSTILSIWHNRVAFLLCYVVMYVVNIR